MQLMQNPTYLRLLLNEFVVSGSSLHKFETCKDNTFRHLKSRFLKKDGEMTQR